MCLSDAGNFSRAPNEKHSFKESIFKNYYFGTLVIFNQDYYYSDMSPYLLFSSSGLDECLILYGDSEVIRRIIVCSSAFGVLTQEGSPMIISLSIFTHFVETVNNS